MCKTAPADTLRVAVYRPWTEPVERDERKVGGKVRPVLWRGHTTEISEKEK